MRYVSENMEAKLPPHIYYRICRIYLVISLQIFPLSKNIKLLYIVINILLSITPLWLFYVSLIVKHFKI